MSADPPSWPTLETTRLRLRRFRDDDLEPFMAYRNDLEVARYQSWEGISLVEAHAFIEAQRETPLGVPGEGAQIAIELKETGALIGDCYFHVEAEHPWQAEIGYTLATEAQGRGLATEAVGAWLTYAFDTFHLHRVIAIVDCENLRSVALLERLGVRREGHFLQNVWFKGKWGDEYLYAALRDEWRARHVARVES
ncbi:MAG TPA: GNAT family protein [Ktedonobacterales bacterium]|nr:GNAT family protein [Ktedonobacterales bacterium]